MIRQPWTLLVAILAIVVLTTPVSAAVLLSDSFNRTLGDADSDGGVSSDWGSNDNALGGSLSGSYTVSNPSGDFDVELVDGDNGVINFGRTILNVNLATPEAISAGAVKVSIDLSPSDIGLSNFHGRDWLGFLLADTNDPASLGGAAALFGGNPDSRVGVGPRNSGTAITRRGPANVRAGGKPGMLTEPIFDQQAWDDYVAWFNGGDGTPPGDPVEEFPNANEYTVELIVSETAPGNLFGDNALNRAELFIGIDGGPLTQVPFDPTNPTAETFSWGDNTTSVGPNAGDATPGVRDAYLVFVANANGGHLFDNLVVSAIPEPTTACLGSLALLSMATRRWR